MLSVPLRLLAVPAATKQNSTRKNKQPKPGHKTCQVMKGAAPRAGWVQTRLLLQAWAGLAPACAELQQDLVLGGERPPRQLRASRSGIPPLWLSRLRGKLLLRLTADIHYLWSDTNMSDAKFFFSSLAPWGLSEAEATRN